MSRIENTGQIKTGYSVKSGTNPEEKVENGADFASMLTKYKKKAAQDDETKKVLSEFWVFQEKVDMKVSAFSFTTSLLVFGYL